MMLHLSVRKMRNDDTWIDDVTNKADVLGIMVVGMGFNVWLTSYWFIHAVTLYHSNYQTWRHRTWLILQRQGREGGR